MQARVWQNTLNHFSQAVSLGLDDGASLSAEELRRVRLLTLTTLALGLIGVPVIIQFIKLGLPLISGSIGLAILCGVLNLEFMRRSRRTWLCGHLAMAILAAVLALPTAALGGLAGPSFAWLYLLPLGAAVVLDVRGAAVWTGVALVITTLFFALPYAGIDLPNSIPLELRHTNAFVSRLLEILAIGAIGAGFVTGQRSSERQLAHVNHELVRETAYVQLLVHAAVSANRATNFAGALRETMERVCFEMDWEGGHICVLDDEGQLVSSGVVYSSDSTRYAQLEHMTLDTVYDPALELAGVALETREPQSVDAFSEDDPSDRAALARSLGLRSALAVPVIVGGEVKAVMEFISSTALPDLTRLFGVFSHICVELARVAERAEMQARLQQSQKMEAVGQLAAGLAHEINNPMSYVRSNLQVLRRDWETLSSGLGDSTSNGDELERLADVGELIDESIEGVERTIAIVRDVKAFSHRGDGNRSAWMPADLSALMEDAFRVASSQAPSGVHFVRELRTADHCLCNANQLRQVFVNLIVNAVQAIGEHGTVKLVTEQDADCLIARVEDDGPGMTKATRERLFDPFFTTKPVGEGTGLGLSVSYEIIRDHGGEIRVASQIGNGTQFEVRLSPESAA
jgi:signal transduction histidine kinase